MDNNRPTLTFVTDHLGELLQDHLNSGMKELNARVLLMARLKDFKPVLPPEEYHVLYRKLIEGQPPLTRNRVTQYIPDGTRWLTRKLRLNPTALFADFRDECMAKFNISGGTYKFKTWPDARNLAGLGEAKAGQPRKKRIGNG